MSIQHGCRIESPFAAAAVALALFTSTPANAEELTAGQLYEFCSSKHPAVFAACRFYIFGAVQGIDLGDGAVMGSDGELHTRVKTLLCLPENITLDRTVTVFRDKARLLFAAYPGGMKDPAVSIVLAVMHKEFPCAK